MLRIACGSDFARLRDTLCEHFAKLIIDSHRYPTTTKAFWSTLFRYALKTCASESLFVGEYRNVCKMYDTAIRTAPAAVGPRPVARHSRDLEQCVRRMVQRAMAHAVQSAMRDDISKTVQQARLGAVSSRQSLD